MNNLIDIKINSELWFDNRCLPQEEWKCIPGFEEKLIGKNIGEEFDIDVTFPEDYGAENLAGKAVVFKIKVHEIKVKELPELDDEFVKDVSEFDTVADYKADVKNTEWLGNRHCQIVKLNYRFK
jgi:trigger factor